MVDGGITKYGLTNLVFCSGTMNNFSYKQFLLFLKQDMEFIKKKYNLPKPLIFQQDNASCHKSKESLEAIEILFGKDKILVACQFSRFIANRSGMVNTKTRIIKEKKFKFKIFEK